MSVTVEAASVLITAVIEAESEGAADNITSDLSTALASTSAASGLLGIAVESTPAVVISQLGGCQPGYLGIAPPWGENCVPCPAGYACAFNATLGWLSSYVCPEGFFCPPGNASAPLPAPAGHAAPGEGNTVAIPCAPGYYAPYSASGTAACLTCPPGHECLSLIHI